MEHRSPSLPGSSGEDSPSLAGWGQAALSRRLGEVEMPTYKELLLDPRWQRKRLEVLEAAGWRCEYCMDGENTLHVHHNRYVKGRKPWEYERSELRALCADCHEEHHAHKRRLDALVSHVDPILLGEIVAVAYGFAAASAIPGRKQDAGISALVVSDLDGNAFHAGALCRMVTDGRAALIQDTAEVVRRYFPEQCFTPAQKRILESISSFDPESDAG